MIESSDHDSENEGSVTRWIELAKEGNGDSFSRICERYFKQLTQIATAQIGPFSKRVIDGEDIANSVLETLCRNVANGRFPDLKDRNDLWRLLLAITNHKVVSQKRSEYRIKRGGGNVFAMTDLQEKYNMSLELSLSLVPTHESVFALTDFCNYLIKKLEDPVLREIARLKLEGSSNREIAKVLKLIPRTVDRKVNLIRANWTRELEKVE